MANHKSAEKRHRQSLKRRARNKVAKTSLRSAVKKARVAIESGDIASSKEASRFAEKTLAKAAAKGIIKKGTAQRTIGRLAKKAATVK